MVAPTAASGPVLAARNWKCVPAGMDRQWCATARETWPAPSSKWAIPPTIARTQTGGSRRHQGHPDGPGRAPRIPPPEVWDRIAAAVAAKTRLLRGLAAGRNGVSMISLGDLDADHDGTFAVPPGVDLRNYSRIDISLQQI